MLPAGNRAGSVGFEFCSAYSASKFGLEGWMQAVQSEVAPFGIKSTIVNPGFFRTKLLTEESTNDADHPVNDHNERRLQQVQFWKSYNSKQSGDPARLANALITISNQENPPLRLIAGTDAIATAERVATVLQQQIDAYRELSTSLAFENAWVRL